MSINTSTPPNNLIEKANTWISTLIKKNKILKQENTKTSVAKNLFKQVIKKVIDQEKNETSSSESS